MATTEAAGEIEKARLWAENQALRQQVADLQAKEARGEPSYPPTDARFPLAESIIAAVQNLVLVGNDRGEVTFVSPSVYRVLGYTPEEVLGEGWLNLTTRDDEERQHVKHYLSAAAKGAVEVRPTPYEREVQDKQGNRRWILWQDARGPGNSIIGIGSDITARKQMEEELRGGEERYRSLFEHAYDGILFFTVEGVITSVNRGLEVMLDRGRADMIGHHYSEFLTPACAAFVDERTRRIQAGERVPSTYELEVIHRDGHIVPLEARTRLIRTAAGAPLGVLGIYRDITERKRAEEALRQAEEQYRSIFENAVEGMFQTTPAGAILSANPAFAHMLGYESPEELKAQVTDVGTQLHVNPHRRAEIIDLLHAQGTVRGVEAQLYRKNGSTLWVSFSIRAVHDAHGTLLYYEGYAEDITQRRAVDQLKDEFVSVVSHELRTPLTSIRGSLGLLASGTLGPISEKGQRMLYIAVRNTDRLVRLINDILDVERIQSGKVTMERQSCNTTGLLAQAVEEMGGMAEKAGLTLNVTAQPLPLWADPDRLVQTLTNLLSNAIKFSPAGSIVWINVVRQGEEALFSVQDQGRGIPAGKLESIFERFQQVDVSDSRDKGGTGLGLAICRSVVHQHGGRIWAESKGGRGSTFYFTLPLFKEGQTASAPSGVRSRIPAGAEKSPMLEATEQQTRRLQVLVAEDDRDLARILIALFERHGAVVYYAQTGTEVIQCCDFVVPDLLVLDPIMPERDGFSVVDWMRQQQQLSRLPVVVYAAGELSAVDQQRLTLGPTLFFTKSRLPLEYFEQQVLQWLARILPVSLMQGGSLLERTDPS